VTPPAALRIQGISKRFGSLLANDNISLELAPGEVLALLGENGAGKSTLVSILFGHLVADSGRMEVFGQTLPPGNPQAALAAGVGMVHQHFALADNLSVLDNVRAGLHSLWSLRSQQASVEAALQAASQRFGLQVDPHALVGSLSVGEQQRVEILKALVRGAKLLILDEPTAVLTPQESEALFATLRELVASGMSIVFISHKLDEVMRLSQSVAVLRHGKLVASARTTQTNPQQLAAWMMGEAPSASDEQSSTASSEPGRVVCELKDLSVALSARERVVNANLVVRAGRITAIAGVSGNGQRALAQCLMGQVALGSGEMRLHTQHLARVPDDRRGQGVVGELSVWENAALAHRSHFARWGWLARRKAQSYAAQLIAGFDIRGTSADGRSPLATSRLSGGNVQKLVLGRALHPPAGPAPELVVAHQPTWGLDVGAVAFVHTQLRAAREAGAAVLLLSDDLDEILALADDLAVMHAGHLSACKPTEEWSRAEIGLAMAGALEHAA
jgi:general nucleoside transport system ATP-binding protein